MRLPSRSFHDQLSGSAQSVRLPTEFETQPAKKPPQGWLIIRQRSSQTPSCRRARASSPGSIRPTDCTSVEWGVPRRERVDLPGGWACRVSWFPAFEQRIERPPDYDEVPLDWKVVASEALAVALKCNQHTGPDYLLDLLRGLNPPQVVRAGRFTYVRLGNSVRVETRKTKRNGGQ
jgi:hypothetical protein